MNFLLVCIIYLIFFKYIYIYEDSFINSILLINNSEYILDKFVKRR